MPVQDWLLLLGAPSEVVMGGLPIQIVALRIKRLKFVRLTSFRYASILDSLFCEIGCSCELV